MAIKTITRNRLINKFCNKNFAPVNKTLVVPVMITSYLSVSKIEEIFGCRSNIISSISVALISLILKLILAS